ncbi:hypothetical protein OIE63_14640 [Streptomyces sp. NBC_01795]|uniref:hypothetical protein n=1 Tax=Streptomyces sp. NBC_01795 TaxID=2975943 RepID=UPI002DDAD087|nr:hypothetical protein [Streptomyces sp. NBC_01795]WSA92664.1 hypothetical protein OIE63_14640 [Streptomyces sp. NBC_01795]
MTVDTTTWNIRPFDGLEGIVPGGIRLGEPRAALAQRFAAAFGERLGERRTFRKGATATGLCDHYPEGGLILFHDDRERLVYVEVFEPAPVAYEGIPLLERPYGEVVAELRGRGCRLVEDESGCEVPEAGFNLTADPDEPEEPVESVGVLTRGRGQEDGPPPGMTDGPRLPGTDTHRIVPHQGTETVRLGEDRHALRAGLGATLASRPAYGGAAQDWYHEHGLILTFDAADRLTTLAVSYAGRTGTATLEGVQLLGRPYEEVVADLTGAGVRVVPGELSARLPDHGVTLHLIAYTNPALPVCAVLLGGPAA